MTKVLCSSGIYVKRSVTIKSLVRNTTTILSKCIKLNLNDIKVQVMKTWLSYEQVWTFVPNSKMTLLLDELSNNPVAISGCIFKITYQVSVMVSSEHMKSFF